MDMFHRLIMLLVTWYCFLTRNKCVCVCVCVCVKLQCLY
uniref:Uncharacterized protein n=1 Tax=Arundo donax TaxID=35708 RepID=A0A0A8Z4V7_ARUDO